MAFTRKTDPFRNKSCRFEDENCMVDSDKDCAQMGVIYEITCNECQDPINLDVEV